MTAKMYMMRCCVSAVGMTHVLGTGLWWVMRTADIRRCRFILNKLTHVPSFQFQPSGQYGLCFGYCFSGPLPLCSNKGQVTFLEPFLGVPSHLDYTQKLAKSILALKLSVTTYFHWVTTTPCINRVVCLVKTLIWISSEVHPLSQSKPFHIYEYHLHQF